MSFSDGGNSFNLEKSGRMPRGNDLGIKIHVNLSGRVPSRVRDLPTRDQ
jgi:hypothetical protein